MKEFYPVSPKRGINDFAIKTSISKSTVYWPVYALRFMEYIVSVEQEKMRDTAQRQKNEKNLFNQSKNSLFKGGDNDEMLDFWR